MVMYIKVFCVLEKKKSFLSCHIPRSITFNVSANGAVFYTFLRVHKISLIFSNFSFLLQSE